MKPLKTFLGPLLCGVVLALAPATAARGDAGDSNADAGPGFHAVVERSQAVMIRVPVNAAGAEDAAAAEIRVYAGPQLGARPTDAAAAWDASTDASAQPVVSRDSNTDAFHNGGYGWYNPYRGNGWYDNYYSGYCPSYYYGGSYYNYGYPSAYNYGNSWYYGNGYDYYYRYYWYPRGW